MIPRIRKRCLSRKGSLGRRRHTCIEGKAHASAGGVPIVLGSSVSNLQADGIIVHFNQPMTMTCDIKDQIDVIIDGAAAIHPTSVVFHPTNPDTMGLILAAPIQPGQVVTWAYDDQGPCDLQSVGPPPVEAENQTYAVTNNTHPVSAFDAGFSNGFGA